MLFQESGEQRYEAPRAVAAPAHNPLPTYLLLGIVAIVSIASLVFIFGLRTRVETLEGQLKAAQDQQAKVSDELSRTQTQVTASSEMLREKLGLTKKDFSKRTAEIAQREASNEQALAKAKEEEDAKIAGVSKNVDAVTADVTGVKGDLGTTKQDLEATKAKLERTIGDLGVQSGLIATTHDELEVLKHSGDRNYYEFTLQKGKMTPVGTVSIELKKTDTKHSRFTLNVMADDNTIEKKDKELNEPVQFYTGRDHLLYELVVNKIQKNSVIGYLASPKGAPKPFQLNSAQNTGNGQQPQSN